MGSPLNKPYPILLNRWKLTLIVSLFIAFFLTVFQPFGLNLLRSEHKTLILLGYGLVTFLLLLFNLFLIPAIFKQSFKAENWKVWKQILWLMYIVLSISVGNYLYSVLVSIVSWAGFRGLLLFVLFTFPIALIPIVAITFITQNIYLKKHLKLSGEINDQINDRQEVEKDKQSIELSSGNQSFQFILSDIVFLESDGNYVNVNYLENGVIKSQLIRNTLKNVSEIIDSSYFFKCHRAFLVNLNKIEKVSGNSHGISIKMTAANQQIPVSRNNTKAFTQRLNAIK